MILCCGEALIDMVPDQTVKETPCLVPKSGGAVFNTAIALGRLGGNVALLTGVSRDLFGRQLRDELQRSNVSCNHLIEMDAPSSLAFVELTNGQAQYTFYTNGAADTQIEPTHCPTDLDAFDLLFFGGISLCTDPTASTMQALMKRASGRAITMIDPNIRPAFIHDETAYRARLTSMMSMADIVKLSDEDLAWLMPDCEDTTSQIHGLNLQSSTVFLLTKGAQGAEIYRDAQRVGQVPTTPTTVIDTIGAGDTFNAGFLNSLVKNALCTREDWATVSEETLMAAAAYANLCAGVTVSRQGANPPWVDEL